MFPRERKEGESEPGGRSLWTELIPGPRKALQLTLRICRRDIYMESYVGSNAINYCNLPWKWVVLFCRCKPYDIETRLVLW